MLEREKSQGRKKHALLLAVLVAMMSDFEFRRLSSAVASAVLSSELCTVVFRPKHIQLYFIGGGGCGRGCLFIIGIMIVGIHRNGITIRISMKISMNMSIIILNRKALNWR